MIFSRHDDGSISVDSFEPTCEVSSEFLAAADPSVFSRDGDTVTFTVANGQATYRVVNERRNGVDDLILDCELLEARRVEI